MAKKQFTFNTFANGLSNDAKKWNTHGYYSAGVDLVGVKDIGSFPNGARPNVLQLSQELQRDTVSGSTVVGLPNWIKKFNNSYYGFISNISSGGEGLIVSAANIGGPWVSSNYTGRADGGGGFAQLSSYMYYGQNANLGKFDGSTYTNTFGAFTIGGTTPRPMKIFAGVLNIGNDRYISTVDSTGTFTANALTLPWGFTVRSLEVLGNYLIISADNGVFARIFLWTGGTATYQEAYDLPETTAPALAFRDGRIFAVGKGIYLLGETSYQTIFPYNYYGTATTDQPLPGSITVWKSRILYGLGGGAGLTNADEQGGVYMIGQYDTTYPLILHQHFLLPNQITSASNYTYSPQNISLGGLYSDNNSSVIVGFQDNTATAISAKYGFASTKNIYSATASNYAYYITLPLTMDSDNKKLFHSIRLNFTGGANTMGLTISYRLNTDFTAGTNLGSWTTLKTISTADNGTQNLAIPIRKTGRNIMFKFQFNAYDDTFNQSPQLLDYSVIYEILNSYR